LGPEYDPESGDDLEQELRDLEVAMHLRLTRGCDGTVEEAFFNAALKHQAELDRDCEDEGWPG
jgi:hypothetical protein